MQRKVFIPEGLTVKHPFFYIIQHTPSGRFYAGCKYASGTCDSETFMTEGGYKTSSKIVTNIIICEGVKSFIIKRIRHFETSDGALTYEENFLSKVNARRNTTFFNKTNGRKSFCAHSWSEARRNKKRPPLSEEVKEKIRKSRLGKPLSEKAKQNMRNAWKNKTRSEAQKLHLKNMSESNKGKPRSEDTRKKLSIAHKGKPRPEEVKIKLRKPKSEKQKRRMSEVNMGKKLSPETIAKREATRKVNRELKKAMASSNYL